MDWFDGATSLDGNGRSQPTLVATDRQKCVAFVKEEFGAVVCYDPSILVGARPMPVLGQPGDAGLQRRTREKSKCLIFARKFTKRSIG